MKKNLIPVLVLAGALAIASIGIVKAQTDDSATVDQPVSTMAESTDSSTAMPCLGNGPRGGRGLETQADRFGMTEDDLKAELESGKPMYQIAAEHGQTYSTMRESHQAELKSRLDDMVKVGYMTQDEADQAYEQAQTNAMPMVGMGGHGLGRGMHGMR